MEARVGQRIGGRHKAKGGQLSSIRNTPDFQFLFLPPGWVIGFLRSADLTIKRLFELLNRAMHLTQVLSTG